MTCQIPAPRFERFERVVVIGEPHHYPDLPGKSGTVLWRDSIPLDVAQRPHLRGSRWYYLLYFSADKSYCTLPEINLRSEGIFDSESTHLGTSPEFSLDCIMDEDEEESPVQEGTYRLPGTFWEVMVFCKEDVSSLQYRPNRPPWEWPSGITGTIFRVPFRDKLNREYVRQALAFAFGHTDWTEVRGPDSMVLR
jgi:hypothetical protein